MHDSAEHALVADYAMGSRQALEAALAVGEAYSFIRARVVEEFLEKLKGYLVQEVGSHWKAGFSPDFMSSSEARVWAVREAGGFTYYAAMEAGARGGGNLCYGVYSMKRDTFEIPMGFSDRLTDAMGRPARSNDIWPWYDYFGEDDRHWSDAGVLLRMWSDCHRDPEEATDCVAMYGDVLVQLTQAIDRAIDAAELKKGG